MIEVKNKVVKGKILCPFCNKEIEGSILYDIKAIKDGTESWYHAECYNNYIGYSGGADVEEKFDYEFYYEYKVKKHEVKRGKSRKALF